MKLMFCVIKKIVYFIFAAVFFVLGGIGIALPVIPQVPFIVAGIICVMAGSKRFYRWIISKDFYRVRVRPFTKKHRWVRGIEFAIAKTHR